MKEYIVPQKFDLQSFLNGNTPEINTDVPQPHIAELSQFMQTRQIQGDGPWVADMALISCRPEFELTAMTSNRTYAGINESSIAGAMIQVFNTHDKSSRLFVLDAHEGHIDWDALRNAIQSHIQSPKDVSNYWQHTSEVDEIRIHHASRFAEQMATEVMTQATDFSPEEKQKFIQDVINGYANSAAGNEYARMIDALYDAINTVSPVGEYLEWEVAQHNVIQNLQDELSKAEWELSKISDIASLNMREQWSGYYTELQHQYTPEQAAALAMATVTTKAMQQYERYQDGPEAPSLSRSDFFVCQQIQKDAILNARELGCTEYEIGQMIHPDIQSMFQFMSGFDQRDAYFRLAASAYIATLPNEHRFAVSHMLQREAAQHNEPIQMDAFVKAMKMLAPQISQITGVPQAYLPGIDDVQKNINIMRQDNREPFTYSVLHAGALNTEQQTVLQENFLRCLVAESVSRQIDTATYAIAMYKAAQELQQEANQYQNSVFSQRLYDVCVHAIQDMEANGINVEDIYAEQNAHDEMSDKDIAM